jgi:hypothetical protein
VRASLGKANGGSQDLETAWAVDEGELSSTRHAHRPSVRLERALVRYPALSSSRNIRPTRSRPIRSPGPARCCNKYRICQPSGFAISQLAILRVSNCRRASSIKAREIGTQPRLRCLIRSTAGSGVFSYFRRSDSGAAAIVSSRVVNRSISERRTSSLSARNTRLPMSINDCESSNGRKLRSGAARSP